MSGVCALGARMSCLWCGQKSNSNNDEDFDTFNTLKCTPSSRFNDTGICAWGFILDNILGRGAEEHFLTDVCVHLTQLGFETFQPLTNSFWIVCPQRGSVPVAKSLGCGARYMGSIPTVPKSCK